MVDGASMRVYRLLVILLLVPLVGACAHVGEDEFDATIADLRTEMAEGDRAVENRLEAQIDAVMERLNMLEGDLQALEERFDAEVERLETAIRVTPPVHFGFDEATLREQYLPVLESFAEVVRPRRGMVVITVEGFTDPAGSDAYNQSLGLERAEAVRDYLTTRADLTGIEIRTISYGEDVKRQVRPGEAGPGNTGWENRRVALVVDFSSPQGAPVAEDGESPEAMSRR